MSISDAHVAKLMSIAWSRTEPASRVERARILLGYPRWKICRRPYWSHSITLAACRLVFVAFTCHLILKRTGTTKDNLLSGMSLGGAGIGWARASMASVS